MVFEVFCSHCQKSADWPPYYPTVQSADWPPYWPMVQSVDWTPIINKNLSSFENLSDPKGPPSPLSTICTSQPLKCDLSEWLTDQPP